MPSEISDAFAESAQKAIGKLEKGAAKAFIHDVPNEETARQIYLDFIAPQKQREKFIGLRIIYSSQKREIVLIHPSENTRKKPQEKPVNLSLAYQMAEEAKTRDYARLKKPEKVPGVKYR